MPSFPTPHDGTSLTKGTILKFGANEYTVTNVVIQNTLQQNNAATISVAHLGQTAGETSATMDQPLVTAATDGNTGRQITFDYIGKNIFLDGATATVYIAIGGTALVGSTGAGATAFHATVNSSTLTLATNDAIRGQAVLTLNRTSSIT